MAKGLLSAGLISMGADIKQNEAYWMDGFRNGNNQALSYFFDLHYKPLSYFATRLTQDEMEAEDIVANCFVKLWKRHEDFQTATNNAQPIPVVGKEAKKTRCTVGISCGVKK